MEQLFPTPEAWPGVEATWSHRREVPSSAPVEAPGTVRTWHYLDNGPALEAAGRAPVGTVLAVHGNPTWSYLWRSVLAAASAAEHPWRVIAVDQLEMGYSERTGLTRTLTDRVTDLGDFTAALGLNQTRLPLVTLAHDWGGLISLGWALRHREVLSGIVLTNTAVFHDSSEKIPVALQAALNPALHSWATEKSPAFIDVTLGLAQKPLDRGVKHAYRLPYRTAEHRRGVRNFVADIPATEAAPSYQQMAATARGITELTVPALMLWGTKDPVFQRRYMADLAARLPQADIHRFERASHLVAEDEDIATPILTWLGENFAGEPTQRERHLVSRAQLTPASAPYRPMLAEISERANDTSVAVVDMGARGNGTEVAAQLSWADLAVEVNRIASGLQQLGVRPGDRVNLLVPPGITLTTLIYACLKLGAVIVVADTGLGARGLTRALKGARPAWLIGVPSALTAARALGWPGTRIAATALPAAASQALGLAGSITDFKASTAFEVDTPDPDADAAVLYTSGSTGPAKGVVYTHRQLAAMRDTIAATYDLKAGAGLVAGFAPFALLGPALGATSVTPAMDVTKPKTLTASALASAAAAIDATVVFASPAAIMNVLQTLDSLTSDQRAALGRVTTMLSAGAPITSQLLTRLQKVLPAASLHTPYGMTEVLPATDISFGQIQQAEQDATENLVGAGDGVCVGTAVHGASLQLAPLLPDGTASIETTTEPGVTGEILVSAPHLKDRYDTLWVTEQASTATPGWHRTGDVGHFDAKGRLWVEGRLAHVLVTAQGVLTPVALEQAAEADPDVIRAAALAVGPAGTSAVVIVAEVGPRFRGKKTRNGLAPADLTARVRRQVNSQTGVDIAALLLVDEQPTDVRHNSKIDRQLLARWAGEVLMGKKARLGKGVIAW
ncbi:MULTISPECIES: alpha/beta fold hydrolase [Rothia]|uniref:Hydrolase n=1 Tax=Rothia nasimurium TaxID=85336 RepID=A0A1Y1RQZ1_9MICC|nr:MULTISPECIES: alpha/beta fold hydrolase [Rothia]ORC22195.1 hydrolase [Rothia nasimurium]